MKLTFCAFLLLIPTLLTVGAAPADAKKAGAKKADSKKDWTAIFNGKDTKGWEMTGPGQLKLVNKELVTEGGMGMLWYSAKKYGNCKIRVVFKLTSSNDNSGIFIRLPERPSDPMQAVNQGYEVQIDNTGDEYHRTGCLYSLTKAKKAVNAKVNKWNKMVITLDGKRTIVKLDGETITDFTEGDPVPPKKSDYEPVRGPRPETGYIGLQNHGGDAKVHFKEVSISPLAKKPKAKK